MMQTCGDINEQRVSRSQPIKIYYLQILTIKKGRFGAVGEKLTHRAPGPGFEAASLHICGGKACFGYPFPRTPLKWEPPSTGYALFKGRAQTDR